MKIPLTYLILFILCFPVLIVLHNKMSDIQKEANLAAARQQSQNIANYQASVTKITDLNFAMRRGLQFLKNHDTQKATALLTQATTLDANYRDSWFYAGYAYLEDLKGRQRNLTNAQQHDLLAKAKTALTQAQKIDPLYAPTYQLLAAISQSEHNDNEKSLWYARYETVSGKKLSNAEFASTN